MVVWPTLLIINSTEPAGQNGQDKSRSLPGICSYWLDIRLKLALMKLSLMNNHLCTVIEENEKQIFQLHN